MPRRVTRPALGLLCLVGAFVPVPTLALNHEGALPDAGAQDLNARGLHILQYHPYPDPQGDPWGSPEPGVANGPRGYMEVSYGVYWYPTAVFDGTQKIEGATEFLQTFNAYESAYLSRRELDSPVRLALTTGNDATGPFVHVDVRAKHSIDSGAVELRVVLFEDEVPFDGGNGVDVHRYVVRALVHKELVTLTEDAPLDRRVHATLNASGAASRFGFVVSLHNRDPSAAHFGMGEVLQAATVRQDQEGPTLQHSRGVLLETLTATWCAACVYGDGAVDELGNAYGLPSSRTLEAGWAYLRPLRAVPILLALGFGLVGGLGTWWTQRDRGPTP